MPESNSEKSPGTQRPSMRPPDFLKYETRYLEWGREHPDFIYPASPDSIQGGFARPSTDRPDSRTPGGVPPMGPPGGPNPRMLKTMLNLQKGMSQSWQDIEPYYDKPEPAPFEPKPALWDELHKLVGKKWHDVRIGFTELPRQMIFRNKFTLFRYALVVSQEMNKDKIARAPGSQAGQEVMRVYSSLGLVVNDIARWLRKQGVRCQSNHPMGGLVNNPSLAGKAGMGWQGRSGILITPEFGPRVRLAPVFIEHRYFEFTDNRDHDWIEEYCELCTICEKECPTQAIRNDRVTNVPDVPGIGAVRTCIIRDRCFEYFSKTAGCAICIKVCPFSQGDNTYERLKAVVEKKTV